MLVTAGAQSIAKLDVADYACPTGNSGAPSESGWFMNLVITSFK